MEEIQVDINIQKVIDKLVDGKDLDVDYFNGSYENEILRTNEKLEIS